MTTRPISNRLNEHLRDLKYGYPSTALAELAINNPIIPDFKNARVIYNTKNKIDALYYESIEILKRKQLVCNKGTSITPSKIWLDLLGIT